MRIPNLTFLGELTSTKIQAYTLFGLSGLFLIACFYMTFNIDVLTDWKITLPNQKIHVGDTVVIKSTYRKLRNVTGEATRSLDCKTKDGIDVRYPLSKAVANRAAGDHTVTGTGIIVVIPTTIPDLPTTCKISIQTDYPVLPWRHVIESNETKEFTLYPRSSTSVKPSSDGSQRTSQTQVQVNNSVSSTQNIPASSNKQSNNSQKPQTPPTQPPTKTVCDKVTLPLVGTVLELNCHQETT